MTPAPDLAHAQWRTSSHTGQANCVQIARVRATYAVRDSKNPAGGHLTFGTAAWHAFLTDIKHGKHDH